MKMDTDRALQGFDQEPVKINDGVDIFYFSIMAGGDPVTGGAQQAQQLGEQYVLRIQKTRYKAPAVHDKLHTKNHGALDVKQFFSEGDLWAVLATGETRNRER